MEQGLEQLPLCYDEARKALEYSRLQAGGGTEPVLFTALDVTHSDYYYPLEAEQQLLQYVRAGDAAKAQEVLGRIFTANFETKRVSTAAARSLLYQLAATLQRLANSDALAQGGGADDVAPAFDKNGLGAIINSSRGIMCAWKKTGRNGEDYKEAARAEAIRMRDEIVAAIR